MSLFNIGGVRLELFPLNAESVDHDTASDFVRHPVIGAQPPMEHVGPGEDTYRLTGKVFPRALGGEAEMALLESLNAAGDAVLVTQGLRKLGWFVITRISRRHTYLDQQGRGRKIELRIELERTGRPSGNSASNMLTRLFGYA